MAASTCTLGVHEARVLLTAWIPASCSRQTAKTAPAALAPSWPSGVRAEGPRERSGRARWSLAVATGSTATEPQVEQSQVKAKSRPGEHKGFVEEMRIAAMKLHTRDQSKDGQKEIQEKPLTKWEPKIEGYVQFLVDSKVVYDVMEEIVAEAVHPMYAEFRNTGLERSARLEKDLQHFASEGLAIPGPSESGLAYAKLLKELSVSDPPAFICHFYNVYFAHSAGGRMIGRKIAEMLLDGRELEFYKWDGDLPTLLSAVKGTLSNVSAGWTREEKDHCLEETVKSFKCTGNLLKSLVS